MSEQFATEDDVLRRAMFVPCQSMEDLHTWICVYLGLNLPDMIVDDESNTSPMQMIWEVYKKAIDNNDETFSRVMSYASRDSFKTLGAAILEVLAVFHLDRDVAHMAAIKPQAQKAMSYVKGFFRLPYLRDYLLTSNESMTRISWYSNDVTGDYYTAAAYAQMLEADKNKLTPHERYINIVICTMQGANSEHVPFFVVDEVDVVPKQNQAAYQEAKSIPSMFDGKEPITLLTSTRKFAFGNVQRELDKALDTGLVVRHWNIIDVTERCPPSRHLPEEPKIPIWVKRDVFSSISQENYDALASEKRQDYVKMDGYAGCLQNCKLFAMCRGNLATKQREHPKDARGQFTERPRPLLKSLRFTTTKFNELTLDMARAQLMCWQASQEGLIYPYLDREKHLLKPHQIAKKLGGETYSDTMTYESLIHLMQGRDGRWVAGVDFGYTHNFAVVLMYVDGFRAFVVGVWTEPKLDPAQKLDLLDRTIKPFNPTIFADTEQPDMISFMKKNGYRCRDWSKKPGSVLGGIESVRYKLMPGIIGDPQLYFVQDAPGVNAHVDVLKLYHWELGADGKPTDQPDEVVMDDGEGNKILDDDCDALRYAVMNTFANRGRIMAPGDEPVRVPLPHEVQSQQEQNRAAQNEWAKQMMQQALGYNQSAEVDKVNEETPAVSGKKGGVYWDL